MGGLDDNKGTKSLIGGWVASTKLYYNSRGNCKECMEEEGFLSGFKSNIIWIGQPALAYPCLHSLHLTQASPVSIHSIDHFWSHLRSHSGHITKRAPHTAQGELWRCSNTQCWLQEVALHHKRHHCAGEQQPPCWFLCGDAQEVHPPHLPAIVLHPHQPRNGSQTQLPHRSWQQWPQVPTCRVCSGRSHRHLCLPHWYHLRQGPSMLLLWPCLHNSWHHGYQHPWPSGRSHLQDGSPSSLFAYPFRHEWHRQGHCHWVHHEHPWHHSQGWCFLSRPWQGPLQRARRCTAKGIGKVGNHLILLRPLMGNTWDIPRAARSLLSATTKKTRKNLPSTHSPHASSRSWISPLAAWPCPWL